MKKKNVASVLVAFALLFAMDAKAEAWSSAYGGINSRGEAFGVMNNAKNGEKLVCQNAANLYDSFETPHKRKKVAAQIRIVCPSNKWNVFACRADSRCSFLVRGKK